MCKRRRRASLAWTDQRSIPPGLRYTGPSADDSPDLWLAAPPEPALHPGRWLLRICQGRRLFRAAQLLSRAHEFRHHPGTDARGIRIADIAEFPVADRAPGH